tara:strand:+ start:421 stop:636 length:216 start_codon:yes stop_codon:yes gene_type:complete
MAKLQVLLANQTIKEQAHRIKLLENGLHDLKDYCRSIKFSADPMVNTSDVLLRIREIQSALQYIDNDFYGE